MVKIPIVLDCACLIGLERIHQLELLPKLFEPILAPPAVISEFGFQPSWLKEADPKDKGMVAALRIILDHGESEAIALAHERGLRIVLDDQKGRQVAKQLGIPLVGTVGLLLRAKQAGLLTQIRPLLDELDACHFRISTALRQEALRLAAE